MTRASDVKESQTQSTWPTEHNSLNDYVGPPYSRTTEQKIVQDTHVHVYMLSPVRLSSVCLSSVTFVHPTHQGVKIFGNISTPFGTLAIR